MSDSEWINCKRRIDELNRPRLLPGTDTRAEELEDRIEKLERENRRLKAVKPKVDGGDVTSRLNQQKNDLQRGFKHDLTIRERAIETLKDTHRKEIQSLEANHADRVAELEANHAERMATQLAELESEFRAEATVDTELNASKLRDAKAALDAKVAEMEAGAKLRVKSCEDYWRNELTQTRTLLRDDYNKRSAAIEQMYKGRMREILVAAQTAVQTLDPRPFTELATRYTAESLMKVDANAFNATMDAARHGYEGKVVEIRKQTNAGIKAGVERYRTAYEKEADKYQRTARELQDERIKTEALEKRVVVAEGRVETLEALAKHAEEIARVRAEVRVPQYYPPPQPFYPPPPPFYPAPFRYAPFPPPK